MLLVLHLVLLASIVLLLLVALAEILSFGCPLATAALGWCKVLRDRWVLPHLVVRASFCIQTRPARACLPVRVTPLWPALWTSFLDKTRYSRTIEVGRIWEFMMSICNTFLDGIRAALGAGDVSTAWGVWSLAAEVSLLSAFQLAACPTPDRGFRCGRGVARFRSTVLRGPVVGKARADFADAEDGQFVHLYQVRSVAGLITQRRRLRSVLEVLDGIARNGTS